MPKETQFAILEMGTSAPGEIAPLSQLCQPYIGIITAIAPAHIEFFESLAAIADEKADIVSGMGVESVAIFNRDTPHFDRLLKKAETQKVGRIIGFGGDPMAQARVVNCQLLPNHSEVEADILGTPIHYTIGSPGRHIVMNSLAVLAAAKVAGADLNIAAQAFANFKPPAGRGQRRFIDIPGGRIELIDESYNANPDSMRAAIAVLAQADAGPEGRRVAILGDMLEMGKDSPKLHADLSKDLRAANLDYVFTCGPMMQHLNQIIGAFVDSTYAANSAELAPLVARAIRPGDVVMVKGSLGSKMRFIVEALDGLRYQEKTQIMHSKTVF
jgi:UDP-N-acetylmuramoyl-tripeptide--D-alanyl-D-alanine ligase